MKIMNAVVTLTLVSLVLLLAPTPRAAELMKSGQWEIDTTMDGQTYTTSRCATPAELKEMNGGPRAVRAYTEKSVNEGHCITKDYKLAADTLSYTIVCPGGKIASTTTYRGNSFEARAITNGSGEKRTAFHVKGRRIGTCP